MQISIEQLFKAAADGNPTTLRARLKLGVPPIEVMTALGVRRVKAAFSSGCKPHPATAPAGSNRSSHGGDEMAEAFG